MLTGTQETAGDAEVSAAAQRARRARDDASGATATRAAAEANPHLNVFDPYRELPRHHEDQLTRAAMIVLRLVPLAREALLEAIGERPQSELPRCVLDMQATHVVDCPTTEGAVQHERLVSVFLTPDIEPFALAQEVTDTDRGQRFDGVLRFDPDLVVVLESKICWRWARRDGHRVAQLNLHGARFDERRTCLLPWHDLLGAWVDLVERGSLGEAERGLVQDVLDFAHSEFAHLLPFGSLRRAGADPTRRERRLRTLIEEASGIAPERGRLVYVRLDTSLGVASMQRAALKLTPEALTLHLWPGELKPQAERLYSSGHAARLSELLAEGRDGASGADNKGAAWRVEPQPLLGFRGAPESLRVYFTCALDPVSYAQRWQGEDFERVGAVHRSHIRPQLWPWLLQRGYASPADEAKLDPFLQTLGRRFAHLRPGIHVAREWPLERAEELDDAGLLVDEVRAALNRVLGLLGEPSAPPRRRRGRAGARGRRR